MTMNKYNAKISNEIKEILEDMARDKSRNEKQFIIVNDLIEEAIMSYYDISLIDIMERRKIETIYTEPYEIENINYPYYVYVYLNPSKKGVYQYEEYYFNNEPFYVGKGQGSRYKSHKNFTHNETLKKVINDLDEEPIIIKIKDGLSQLEAHYIENNLINSIGKLSEETGPLCNILSGSIVKEQYEKSFLNIESMKYVHIIKSLNRNRSIKKASEELGMSERTLYRKIKSLNIEKKPDSGIYYMKK